MRISEQWLREWVDVAADTETIAERLTMAGLEVDEIGDAAPASTGVVIGEVTRCEPHPDADKLKVCDVDTGATELAQIVCGAPNVATGVRVPVATVGTRLPGGMKIKAAKLRGVASNGMLCSAAELGLSSDSAGLWLLPADAPVGSALADYLGLPDRILDIDLTPDRGDCLSLRGVAREVAVAFDTVFAPTLPTPPVTNDSPTARVVIEAPSLCALYGAQYVEAVDPRAGSPVWIRERLRRAGVRAISMPVDIGNYVMLEIGQPMHAFDADKLVGGIVVRQADAGERIVTLDGQDVELAADTLVIADDEGPVAIAGMIGGQRTAVSDTTTRVLFEAACFTPAAVAGQGRRYKIHTDSLHRFERGVDPDNARQALARASALLVELAGGQPGPATITAGEPVWADDRGITLRASQIERLLGQSIADDVVVASLTALGAHCETTEQTGVWHVTPPSWRYDLAIEPDLIEEVARIYGYDRLTSAAGGVSLPAFNTKAGALAAVRPAEVLRQRGYHEAITYSFVDAALHAELTDNAPAIVLDNPISDQMTTMRRTLWAGLIGSWDHNARRQQGRVRLFETGLRFIPDETAEHGMAQIDTLAGLATGAAIRRHWDSGERAVDFFDIKGDIEALFAGLPEQPTFVAAPHPALHPGRSARIDLAGQPIGWAGQLAPAFSRRYKTSALPYLFEIDRRALYTRDTLRYQPPSDQPSIRRDLALVVPEDVIMADLRAAIAEVQSPILRSVEVFDVFRGQDLAEGFKSIALSLIFQDKASTLDDNTVEAIVADMLSALRERTGAYLRGE